MSINKALIAHGIDKIIKSSSACFWQHLFVLIWLMPVLPVNKQLERERTIA